MPLLCKSRLRGDLEKRLADSRILDAANVFCGAKIVRTSGEGLGEVASKGCHPEPKAKDPAGFFASLRMTSSMSPPLTPPYKGGVYLETPRQRREEFSS